MRVVGTIVDLSADQELSCGRYEHLEVSIPFCEQVAHSRATSSILGLDISEVRYIGIFTEKAVLLQMLGMMRRSAVGVAGSFLPGGRDICNCLLPGCVRFDDRIECAESPITVKG